MRAEGSDACDGNSGDSGGHVGFRGGGEEKLVVFASVERGLESFFGCEFLS